MELPVLAVLLASFILTINSHPKSSDILPKDYYKRQILQPIPGYIPVYIKADEEPLIRRGIKNHSPDVHPQKVYESEEKNLFKQVHEETPKNEEQILDEMKSEAAVKETKQVSEKPETSENVSNSK